MVENNQVTKMKRQERMTLYWQADEFCGDESTGSSMQTNPQGRSTQRRAGQSSNCLTESEEISTRPSLLSHTIMQLQSTVIESEIKDGRIK